MKKWLKLPATRQPSFNVLSPDFDTRAQLTEHFLMTAPQPIVGRHEMNTEKLRAHALDLNQHAPRSPRVPLTSEFPVVAARLVDKCRAELLGQSGSYHFNCPMDQKFLTLAGLKVDPLREFIATGATDDEVAAWMRANATAPKEKIVEWGGRFWMNLLWRILDFEDRLHERRQRKTPG